jgi:single-stranded-DNA-specific exonuclease
MYGRPTAVLAASELEYGVGEPLLKASARSVAGIDMISLLRRHEEMFVMLGGLAMAACFSIRASDEDKLRAALESDVKSIAEEHPEIFSPEPYFDMGILPGEATLELAEALEAFEPTGTGNPKPVMRLSGVSPGNIKRMGADKRHLKFNAEGLECVMFARGDTPAELPADSDALTVYGYLGLNRWNGHESVQLIVREISC